jgi:hypothetical protein
MPTIADLIRDSPIGRAMFAARYAEQDPHQLAVSRAADLGYPQPGASNDQGEAQRYAASNIGAQRFGLLPLLTNPLHEAVLSWVAEGEGTPSLDRLLAGYRGTYDALEQQGAAAQPTPAPSIAQLMAAPRQ